MLKNSWEKVKNGSNGVLVGARVDIRVWMSPGGPGGAPGGGQGAPGGPWGPKRGDFGFLGGGGGGGGSVGVVAVWERKYRSPLYYPDTLVNPDTCLGITK